MKIMNYTSTVPVDRSIANIERRLTQYGVRNILKEYDESGNINGIAFSLEVKGRQIPFRMPARIEKVQEKLWSSIRRPNKETIKRINDQSKRTAWKIISNWVDVQITLVELGQVEIMEVFLPFVYDPASRQTFFERLKSDNFSQLALPELTVDNR